MPANASGSTPRSTQARTYGDSSRASWGRADMGVRERLPQLGRGVGVGVGVGVLRPALEVDMRVGELKPGLDLDLDLEWMGGLE